MGSNHALIAQVIVANRSLAAPIHIGVRAPVPSHVQDLRRLLRAQERDKLAKRSECAHCAGAGYLKFQTNTGGSVTFCLVCSQQLLDEERDIARAKRDTERALQHHIHTTGRSLTAARNFVRVEAEIRAKAQAFAAARKELAAPSLECTSEDKPSPTPEVALVPVPARPYPVRPTADSSIPRLLWYMGALLCYRVRCRVARFLVVLLGLDEGKNQ